MRLHAAARHSRGVPAASAPACQIVAVPANRTRHFVSACKGTVACGPQPMGRTVAVGGAAISASVGGTPAFAVFSQMLPTVLTAKERFPVTPGFAAVAEA